MKELGELENFLGFEIELVNDEIFICQQKYAKDLLQKYGVLDCKPVLTLLEINSHLCSTEGKDLEDGTIY
jgi:hypothetical protein